MVPTCHWCLDLRRVSVFVLVCSRWSPYVIMLTSNSVRHKVEAEQSQHKVQVTGQEGRQT
jgi:hypothetical protein